MLDRAALFIELTRRNALRQRAQLPLLDIPAEYERAVRLAEWKMLCEEQPYEQTYLNGIRWQISARVQQWRVRRRR
jgi:hypothetical protein